jgi:hypothetical protein
MAFAIRKWRKPSSEEQPGGRWLVDRMIRIFSQDNQAWHEAHVTKYNPNPDAIDSSDHIGPNNFVEFVEFKEDIREENLKFTDWELDASQDVLVEYDCGEWCGDYSGETKVNDQSDKIPHGIGCLDAHPMYTVRGDFFNGVPHGKCIIDFHRFGKTYDGHLKDGREDGPGKLTYSDGSFEQGIFKNRKLIQGTFRFANGVQPKQYQTKRDNETPREIARKFNLNESTLIAINNASLKGRKSRLLERNSRLNKGTIIILEREEGSSESQKTEDAFQDGDVGESSLQDDAKKSEFYEVQNRGGDSKTGNVAEVVSRDMSGFATVRFLRSPIDLQSWASNHGGDITKFDDEFRLADFDIDRELLYTFEEAVVPLTDLTNKVSVFFSANGKKVTLTDPSHFLCRFVWDPRMPKLSRRPCWNRCWSINANDYKKSCMKILEHLLNVCPAKESKKWGGGGDKDDDDEGESIDEDSGCDSKSASPVKRTDSALIGRSSQDRISSYCLEPLNFQKDIKGQLIRSNRYSDFESDEFCDEYVMAFWKSSPSKGWWFGQIKDTSPDESKRFFQLYTRSQRANKAVVQHSNITCYACICVLGERKAAFACVLSYIRDRVNREDAQKFIERDEAEDLGPRPDIPIKNVDYFHKIVKIMDKSQIDVVERFALVVGQGVQNLKSSSSVKSLRIVRLLTRDQVKAYSQNTGALPSWQQQLESSDLQKSELLYTNWLDRVSVQSVHSIVSVKLILSNAEGSIGTDSGYFCRFACKCHRNRDGAVVHVEFSSSWTLLQVAKGLSGKFIDSKEYLLDWITTNSKCEVINGCIKLAGVFISISCTHP